MNAPDVSRKRVWMSRLFVGVYWGGFVLLLFGPGSFSAAAVMMVSPLLLMLLPTRGVEPRDPPQVMTRRRWQAVAAAAAAGVALSGILRWPAAADPVGWAGTMSWMQAFIGMWCLATVAVLGRHTRRRERVDGDEPGAGLWPSPLIMRIVGVQFVFLLAGAFTEAVIPWTATTAGRQTMSAAAVGLAVAAATLFAVSGDAGLSGLRQSIRRRGGERAAQPA